MHSFIIQIFTFKTLIVFQKLGTIRMLVKNSTGLSNLEEKREYSPTDHVRYYNIICVKMRLFNHSYTPKVVVCF